MCISDETNFRVFDKAFQKDHQVRNKKRRNKVGEIIKNVKKIFFGQILTQVYSRTNENKEKAPSLS